MDMLLLNLTEFCNKGQLKMSTEQQMANANNSTPLHPITLIC
ncbi:hypothetical protein ARAF_1653 [Arsenophonus endosymbiont of Aleurodicus floccissimus]|nr:hypothetical protein ARAF_1653 [Arsenophonus endosymbiont of Aleurodicus floccissimus]